MVLEIRPRADFGAPTLISRFFIDRPIFASVLSIVITLAGAIASTQLPIALYPPISPPTVQVDCNFPGANAQVVSESVATPIEQQVNGVENMLYMSSQCTNDGTYNLTVTFKHGVNLNMALVMVQNRVSLAVPMLPDVLKQTGVNVKKKAPDILMAVAVNSPDNSRDQLFLSNYTLLHMKEVVARLPGVSDVSMLGQRDYSMRIWVDPDKMAARNLQAGDIVAAIREQNQQVATGQIGQPPAPRGQAIQVPLSILGRLTDVEQFENIIIRATEDGRFLRIKDVARVELGALTQDMNCQVNGKPSVSMAVFQLPDANALDTAVVVKEKIAELAKDFPPGVGWEIRYDTTPYITESIDEVFKTLREAVILVAVVVLLFLQSWRSSIIPLIAVPVAIIGTFAAMAALGFSLNNLTLFGLVLAIGIVVDDAIVVVEAVEHHIEHGMSPRDATVRAMEEVSGPVIAIGLVLTAVFVPCAFISGIVGQFFRQFALTIAVSTVISAFNSLTLSPALAALLLKPRTAGSGHGAALPRVAYALGGGWLAYDLAPQAMSLAARLLGVDSSAYTGLDAFRHRTGEWLDSILGVPASHWTLLGLATTLGLLVGWLVGPPLDRLLRGFFHLFNYGFKKATNVYGAIVGGMLRVSLLVLLFYGGLLYMTYWGFTHTPAGFIPSQDMGYLLVNVQLSDSTSLEKTQATMNEVERIAKAVPGVRHSQTMAGQSMLLSANGSNFGSMFLIFDSFEDRRLDQERRGKEYREKVAAVKRTLAGSGLDPSGEAYKAKEAAEIAKVPKEGLDQSGDAIQKALRARYATLVPEAMITVLGPPPVRGVGRAGGFKLMIEDRGDIGPRALQAQTEKLVEAAKLLPNPNIATGLEPIDELAKIALRYPNLFKGDAESEAQARRAAADPGTLKPGEADHLRPVILGKLAASEPAYVGLTSVFRANVPQLYVDVDRIAAMTKEVLAGDLFDTLRIYLGSNYVNDINLYGRTWRVTVQAEPTYRDQVDDIARLKVRNIEGKMVPIGSIADVKMINAPQVLTRYNMYPAAPMNGASAPGVSSGEGIDLLQGLVDHELRRTTAPEWTELAYLEIQAGNTAMVIFGFAVVMVFLVLAAQYESWSLPLAIILVVPMCLLSAVIGVQVAKQDINIFTQIGFVVLVGLASKNAILIVEFAKHRREEGETPRQAALDACILRLRPIVMTSMAFILGVLPLMVSHGAGAEMRQTLGTTVFSGMVGVTIFGIFLTPVFFYVIDVLGETSLFRSRQVRLVATVALVVLTLGLPWIVRSVAREIRRPRRRTAPLKPPAPLELPEPAEAPELVEQK